MEERDWIARSQHGDLESFNRLVERYQDQAYSLVYRILGDAAGAEDVVQEAFIAAYRGVGGLRGENFRAWLLRIAVNACHDWQRKRLRHPEISLDAQADQDDAGELKLPAAGDGPEEHALLTELSHLQIGRAHV